MANIITHCKWTLLTANINQTLLSAAKTDQENVLQARRKLHLSDSDSKNDQTDYKKYKC